MTLQRADPGSIKEQSGLNLNPHETESLARSKASPTHSCTSDSREVDVPRKGGAGGCMLGGSEEDRCLPVRSREPGFQPGDP